MKASVNKEPVAPVGSAAPPVTEERRRFPRFPCEGTGEVIVLGGALRFSGQICDLSACGCRMTTEVMFRLERGTQVEVVLVVSNVHFRVAAGVRSNHKTRGVGLEFMHVSPRCAWLIQELIEQLQASTAREERADKTVPPACKRSGPGF